MSDTHWQLAAEFAAEFGSSRGVDAEEYMGAAYIGIARAAQESSKRGYLFSAAWNEMLLALIEDQRGTRSRHYRPSVEITECEEARDIPADLDVDWEGLSHRQWEAVRGLAHTRTAHVAHTAGVQPWSVIKRLRRAQHSGRIRPH